MLFKTEDIAIKLVPVPELAFPHCCLFQITSLLVSGGDWQIWECLDTASTTVTLQKLVKGQEYQVRVIAINKAGRSEPSVASRPKMAKETDCKHRLILQCQSNFVNFSASIY